MQNKKNLLITLVLMLGSALVLHFFLLPFAHNIFVALLILVLGIAYPLTKAAGIIEASTDILSKKTGLAAGLLQSLGTAFPDMILGVTAAIISLSLVKDNPDRAISFALIAAATTFGSNIYNIGHAAWCVYRQNRSDKLNKNILMFPYIEKLGILKPLAKHGRKPHIGEIDIAIRLLTILSILTATVALAMVAFGRVTPTLYQLIRPAGIILLMVTIWVIYSFRQKSGHIAEAEEAESESGLSSLPLNFTWIALIVAGITIAFSAESMVKALEIGSDIAGIPYVISGAMAGIIGCLGEMIVIHNYSIHQNGRLGDAIVGVAMDNIVTIMGASIVAIIGGIFLGGTSLIVLFILILTLNSVLIEQISILKTTLTKI